MSGRPFAVFAIAPAEHAGGETVAATTRAADRGEAGRVGLPGGKVDAGEDPRAALWREAREEGWDLVGIHYQPCHRAIVDGRPVWWYRAEVAVARSTWKEQPRGIVPVAVTAAAVRRSGYGNAGLPTLPGEER